MKEYIRLIKNIGFLTIGNLGTKLLNFFFVPLYTTMLSGEEYGTYDLLSTTLGILIPFLAVSIFDALVRFSLDPDCDHAQVFSISLQVAFRGALVFLGLVAANVFLNILPIVNAYLGFFILSFFSLLIQQLVSSLARGLDRVADVAISGLLQSLVLITLNIVFLVGLRWGLKGYFIAQILSSVTAILFIALRIRVFRYVRFHSLDRTLKEQMMSYSKPLVLNTIAWWIVTASDRYVVTWLVGVAANGVYSVAYKIPSMLAVLQNIFNNAWQLSATNMYDKDDSKGFINKIYSVYNLLMVLGCWFVNAVSRPLAALLYAKEFYEAWRYVPYLMISVVFGSLLGVFGGVFQAAKNAIMQRRTTIIGAGINVVLNIFLVSRMGPLGAAIATMIVYFVMWAVAAYYVRKFVRLEAALWKDCGVYCLLLIQAIVLTLMPVSVLQYGTQIVLLLLILLVYRKEMMRLWHIIRDVAKKNRVYVDLQDNN